MLASKALSSWWESTLVLMLVSGIHGSLVDQVDMPIPSGNVSEISAEKLLTRFLKTKYAAVGRDGRPVTDRRQPTPVSLGLGLIRMDLDEKLKVLITSMWLKMSWYDAYLHWSPDDYDDIERVRMSTHDVWLPDVMLINTADPNYDVRNDLVMVNHNGTLTWVPHLIFRSSCSIDVSNFPFDTQTCYMWFGSWTHTNQEINITLGPEGLDLSTFEGDYKESSEWHVINATSQKIEGSDGTPPTEYDVLQFSVVLRRKLVFSSYILTLPCVFLGAMTVLVFCLPPERPDRTALAMSTFSSLLVLLLILVEAAPPTAASVPKLGVYYCFNMVTMMLSIFLSSLVVNINNRGNGHAPVPACIRVLLVDILGCLLFVTIPTCGSVNGHRTSKRKSDYPAEGDWHAENPYAYDEVPTAEQLHALDNTSETISLTNILRNGDNMETRKHMDVYFLQLVNHVRDIKRAMFKITAHFERTSKENGSRDNVREWKAVAAVLDRLFTLLYTTGMVCSLLLLFPRP